MAYLAYGLAYYSSTFFIVFITLHFEAEFGVKEKDMGYYFAILSFPSVVTAILFPIIFAKTPRKL